MTDPRVGAAAYLGDAVYASFDGSHVVLTTGSHVEAEATNTIYLEPSVLKALDEFRKGALTA